MDLSLFLIESSVFIDFGLRRLNATFEPTDNTAFLSS